MLCRPDCNRFSDQIIAICYDYVASTCVEATVYRGVGAAECGRRIVSRESHDWGMAVLSNISKKINLSSIITE